MSKPEITQGKIEVRVTSGEVRSATDDDGARIIGYGAVFNSLSEDLGGFVEEILPGAFTEAIKTDDVRGFFNHDTNLILGRNKAGTLSLSETDDGLRYEIDPPDTSYANDLMVSIERGDVSQSSFGFSVEDRSDEEWLAPDEWNPTAGNDGLYLRRIKRAKLYDVSPVTYPAYKATTVSARTLDEFNHQLGSRAAGNGVKDSDAAGRLALRKLKHEFIKRFGRIKK